VLYKYDFKFLTVGDNENKIVITLEALIALLNYTIGSYDQSPYKAVCNVIKPLVQARYSTAFEFEDLNPLVSGH
jgi:hypothetical protein